MFSIKNNDLDSIKDEIGSIASAYVVLTQDIGHQELIETAQDVEQHITDPYLFVIVGEVKAGKSSFINALLQTGKEICKVAPSPMTDTIQQVTYGEEASEIIINQYLKRIHQPVEILKEISIVDTPGTNTIIEHHQEITERFVPAADLIVFVFEAKNPYRESAWQFFDYINSEWWKKVVFVLQQKDLMETDDLAVNKKGVLEYAAKKGITDPRVFAVSAKLEQEGNHEESGYPELREYIQSNLLEGKAPILKQKNNLRTLQNIQHKLKGGLDLRREQYEADVAFRSDIRETLDQQERKTSNQVEILVENLVAAYERVTQPKLNEIRTGLGFFSMLGKTFKSTFGSQDSPQKWLESILQQMEYDLNTTLKDKLNFGVIDIADSIQQMGKMVDLKLRNSKTILKDDHEIFSDIAEKRANVLRELQESFATFLSSTENFYDKELAESTDSIVPNMAAAGGITAVGLILAAVTNGMVFDITGGLLTTAGLLFAGVSLGFKRGRIIRDFTSEVQKGRKRFQTEVKQHLIDYVGRIKERIDENFSRFDEHLDREGQALTDYSDRIDTLSGRITVMDKKLS